MRLFCQPTLLTLTLFLAAACGSSSAIEDQPNGEVDKSTASWTEPGAVADEPLDAGAAPSDAGTPDTGAPLDAGDDAGVADAGDSNDDSGQSDAGADAG